MTLPEDPWDSQTYSLPTPLMGTMGTEATLVWAQTIISPCLCFVLFCLVLFCFILFYFLLPYVGQTGLQCASCSCFLSVANITDTQNCVPWRMDSILTEISIFMYTCSEHSQPFLGLVYECGISVYWVIPGMNFTFLSYEIRTDSALIAQNNFLKQYGVSPL